MHRTTSMHSAVLPSHTTDWAALPTHTVSHQVQGVQISHSRDATICFAQQQPQFLPVQQMQAAIGTGILLEGSRGTVLIRRLYHHSCTAMASTPQTRASTNRDDPRAPHRPNPLPLRPTAPNSLGMFRVRLAMGAGWFFKKVCV